MIITAQLKEKLLKVFSENELFGLLNSNLANSLEFNYLDISTDKLGISYITKDREDRFDGNFNDISLRKRFATKTKASKVFAKLGITNCKTLETLNALFENEDDEYKMVEVSGEDIVKYYYSGNYDMDNLIGSNPLANSCMKHSCCSEYIEFYANEPNIKMIIRLNTTNDKIVGRALLWKIEDEYYMDRIYGDNIVKEIFIMYAELNGYWYKTEQNFNCDEWTKQGYNFGESKDLSFKISKRYSLFPYMDTFKYINPSNSDDNLYLRTISFTNEDVKLDDTEGNRYWENLERCGCCGSNDELFETYDGDFVCQYCLDENYIYIYGNYYNESSSLIRQCEHCGDWFLVGDKSYNSDYPDLCNYCEECAIEEENEEDVNE